jgi:proline dehydrogenase
LKFKDSYDAAVERKIHTSPNWYGYMEKERNRAIEMGYPSPIQPDKESSDRDYNEGVEFCIDHIDRIALIVASHNEYSNLLATELLQKKNLPLNHPHVHWSQLYGMSDNITFNLAHAGCRSASTCLLAPLKMWCPT